MAIAHLLRSYDILEGDPEESLDAYFRQCSILVSARDLAVMGATLANDGVNPITAVRAVEADKVPLILSVMATCGMYDYSGNWIFRVGMPAKSGVSGGVVAVLPGQLGLAIFSPRLDAKGNSVRGIAVCEALSGEIGLHRLRVTRTTTASVVRSSFTGAKVRSKVNRDLDSETYLNREGERIWVLELSGELMFVSAEIAATRAIEEMQARDFLIIDFTHTTAIDHSASTLLAGLMERLCRQGKMVLVCGAGSHYQFSKFLRSYLRSSGVKAIVQYADVDHALEYAEDRLLAEFWQGAGPTEMVPLEEQPLCSNLEDDEVELLRSLLQEERYQTDDVICREGQPADKLFFLCSGRVSASVKLDHKRRRRLNASATGWAFGESALFEGRARTADILAESSVVVYTLAPAALKHLGTPGAKRVLTKLQVRLAELSLERLALPTRELKFLGSSPRQ